MKRKEEQLVGDLFVTKDQILIKLLPTKKAGAKPIEWFSDGTVTDHETAAQDIAGLVERLKGRAHVVRGLTLMTDRGADFDLRKSGLTQVIRRAGFELLN